MSSNMRPNWRNMSDATNGRAATIVPYAKRNFWATQIALVTRKKLTKLNQLNCFAFEFRFKQKYVPMFCRFSNVCCAKMTLSFPPKQRIRSMWMKNTMAKMDDMWSVAIAVHVSSRKVICGKNNDHLVVWFIVNGNIPFFVDCTMNPVAVAYVASRVICAAPNF